MAGKDVRRHAAVCGPAERVGLSESNNEFGVNWEKSRPSCDARWVGPLWDPGSDHEKSSATVCRPLVAHTLRKVSDPTSLEPCLPATGERRGGNRT